MSEVSEQNAEIFGSKAVELKKLVELGFNVPKFFVVTQEVFDAVLELNDAKTEMEFLNTKLKGGNVKEILERQSNLISNLKIPDQIADELYKRYLKLGYHPGAVKSAFDLVKQQREIFVALRCSDPNPFLDTYTNIKGKSELIKAIKLCWMSHFSLKAYEYRQKHPAQEPIALIVQRMVLTEKAGEVDSPEQGVLRIRAFWGQTGFLRHVKPDEYFVSEETNQISSKRVGLQQHMFILDTQKESFTKRGLPEEAKDTQVLEEDEIVSIARIAHTVRQHLGNVSVEFGAVSYTHLTLPTKA